MAVRKSEKARYASIKGRPTNHHGHALQIGMMKQQEQANKARYAIVNADLRPTVFHARNVAPVPQHAWGERVAKKMRKETGIKRNRLIRLNQWRDKQLDEEARREKWEPLLQLTEESVHPMYEDR